MSHARPKKDEQHLGTSTHHIWNSFAHRQASAFARPSSIAKNNSDTSNSNAAPLGIPQLSVAPFSAAPSVQATGTPAATSSAAAEENHRSPPLATTSNSATVLAVEPGKKDNSDNSNTHQASTVTSSPEITPKATTVSGAAAVTSDKDNKKIDVKKGLNATATPFRPVGSASGAAGKSHAPTASTLNATATPFIPSGSGSSSAATKTHTSTLHAGAKPFSLSRPASAAASVAASAASIRSDQPSAPTWYDDYNPTALDYLLSSALNAAVTPYQEDAQDDTDIFLQAADDYDASYDYHFEAALDNEAAITADQEDAQDDTSAPIASSYATRLDEPPVIASSAATIPDRKNKQHDSRRSHTPTALSAAAAQADHQPPGLPRTSSSAAVTPRHMKEQVNYHSEAALDNEAAITADQEDVQDDTSTPMASSYATWLDEPLVTTPSAAVLPDNKNKQNDLRRSHTPTALSAAAQANRQPPELPRAFSSAATASAKKDKQEDIKARAQTPSYASMLGSRQPPRLVATSGAAAVGAAVTPSRMQDQVNRNYNIARASAGPATYGRPKVVVMSCADTTRQKEMINLARSVDTKAVPYDLSQNKNGHHEIEIRKVGAVCTAYRNQYGEETTIVKTVAQNYLSELYSHYEVEMQNAQERRYKRLIQIAASAANTNNRKIDFRGTPCIGFITSRLTITIPDTTPKQVEACFVSVSQQSSEINDYLEKTAAKLTRQNAQMPFFFMDHCSESYNQMIVNVSIYGYKQEVKIPAQRCAERFLASGVDKHFDEFGSDFSITGAIFLDFYPYRDPADLSEDEEQAQHKYVNLPNYGSSGNRSLQCGVFRIPIKPSCISCQARKPAHLASWRHTQKQHDDNHAKKSDGEQRTVRTLSPPSRRQQSAIQYFFQSRDTLMSASSESDASLSDSDASPSDSVASFYSASDTSYAAVVARATSCAAAAAANAETPSPHAVAVRARN
jgi:hypothetical protein